MNLQDTILSVNLYETVNEDGDTIEQTERVPLGKGKCIILPNGAATEKNGEDGISHSTSYTVMMKKPDVIPQEGDIVHIKKKDGSIDKDCEVKGFVTLKMWLKLWLQ